MIVGDFPALFDRHTLHGVAGKIAHDGFNRTPLIPLMKFSRRRDCALAQRRQHCRCPVTTLKQPFGSSHIQSFTKTSTTSPASQRAHSLGLMTTTPSRHGRCQLEQMNSAFAFQAVIREPSHYSYRPQGDCRLCPSFFATAHS